MSAAPERTLTRLLAGCGESFAPLARWQDRVLARVERDETRAREELLVRALYDDDDPEARRGLDGCVCPPPAPPATTCTGNDC